ncbi:amidohydrolase family protein [Devosia sp. A8/3-2]|nr:amidohydrolase family protein [Devosia sp. A8/3-2]
MVGKVVMDDPAACPDFYRDASPEAAIAGTRAVINHIRTHPANTEARVLPVITPRFIPSCTDEVLTVLGQLAAECDCHVQTHCSESDWAHGHVLNRYGHTDAQALDNFGLLTRKSVLAHSISSLRPIWTGWWPVNPPSPIAPSPTSTSPTPSSPCAALWKSTSM